MTTKPAVRANLRHLSNLKAGGLTGFSEFHYESREHALSEVKAHGYFNDCGGKLMRAGDFVKISAKDGASINVVALAEEGRVELAQLCGVFTEVCFR